MAFLQMSIDVVDFPPPGAPKNSVYASLGIPPYVHQLSNGDENGSFLPTSAVARVISSGQSHSFCFDLIMLANELAGMLFLS